MATSFNTPLMFQSVCSSRTASFPLNKPVEMQAHSPIRSSQSSIVRNQCVSLTFIIFYDMQLHLSSTLSWQKTRKYLLSTQCCRSFHPLPLRKRYQSKVPILSTITSRIPKASCRQMGSLHFMSPWNLTMWMCWSRRCNTCTTCHTWCSTLWSILILYLEATPQAYGALIAEKWWYGTNFIFSNTPLSDLALSQNARWSRPTCMTDSKRRLREGRSCPRLSCCLRWAKTTEVFVTRLKVYILWVEVYLYNIVVIILEESFQV